MENLVKKALLGMVFLFFLSFVTANAITTLKVPSQVLLDKELTVSGTYAADSNNGILCSFRVFDDENFLIIRLSDEYTFTDGTFSTEYKLTEPLFGRGATYRINATCNTVSKDAYFSVGQRKDMYGMNPDIIMNDFAWWIDGNNSFTVVVFLIVVIAFVGSLYLTFKQI